MAEVVSLSERDRTTSATPRGAVSVLVWQAFLPALSNRAGRNACRTDSGLAAGHYATATAGSGLLPVRNHRGGNMMSPCTTSRRTPMYIVVKKISGWFSMNMTL